MTTPTSRTRPRERGAEILGVGLTCAVGLRAAAAAVAVRAGLARFQESNTFDRRGQPFILARVPRDRLPDLPEGTLRLDFRPKTLRERALMWRRRYGL